jgi:hypothetical protein
LDTGLHHSDVIRGQGPKIIATMHKTDWPAITSRVAGVLVLLVGILLAAGLCVASPHDNPVPSIFEPRSTNAESLYHLSNFVLAITGVIFVVSVTAHALLFKCL